MPARPFRAVLSIAGSDSGGGAGIQADLKAFARCGVHGMTAITALTAQSTVGVSAIHPVPGPFIVEQVRAVAEDIGVDAVKIGMLGTAETVVAVREALDLLPDGTPIVIDPVMVAESGAVLLDDDARAAIAEVLLPLATVITPNLPEARVLAAEAVDGSEDRARADRGEGRAEAAGAAAEPAAVHSAVGAAHAGGEPAAVRAAVGAADAPAAVGDPRPAGADDAETLARRLHALGPGVVVVTGGHREAAVDVLFDGTDLHAIPGERHPDGAAHGSGCTHSSALAAHLALGHTPLEAAQAARRLAGEAVRNGLRGLGRGAGPVDVLSLTKRVGAVPRATEVATPLA